MNYIFFPFVTIGIPKLRWDIISETKIKYNEMKWKKELIPKLILGVFCIPKIWERSFHQT